MTQDKLPWHELPRPTPRMVTAILNCLRTSPEGVSLAELQRLTGSASQESVKTTIYKMRKGGYRVHHPGGSRAMGWESAAARVYTLEENQQENQDGEHTTNG